MRDTQESAKVTHVPFTKKCRNATKYYWDLLGPGLVTGASGQDPSGIATFTQTGAGYGYHFLWLAAWLFPLDANMEQMCARIGLSTGKGLAANIREHFPAYILYACAGLMFLANAANIGADLGAMAAGTQLLLPGTSYFLLLFIFALFSVGFQVFTPYSLYSKYLKWLSISLFSYVIAAFCAHLDWARVLSYAVIPQVSFSKDELLIICAILGTTISPYLFFWQTSQEVEEIILSKKKRHFSFIPFKKNLRLMEIDVWSGMFFSEAIMFFIIAVSAGVLYTHGITNIQTAAQAAEALRPFAGAASYWLFAGGIISSGLLAIPVLAGSSSYIISETFKWDQHLNNKLSEAHGFYGIILLSIIFGVLENFLHIDPIKALIYAAIVNGIVAPIIMVFILSISSNKKIMGKWMSSKRSLIVGWITTVLMGISGIAALYVLFT